jgi:hypothetical protein
MEQTLDQTVVVDPWESAENPVFRASEYWGQINIEMWYCVLEKGVGKILFDAQVHDVNNRRTAIEMILLPLAEQNISFEVSRSTIAESADWAKIVLPSIKDLGLSPRDLNNKWVKLRYKGTGRTYKKDGQEKENTTFEFLKVFSSEAECRADFTGGEVTPTVSTDPNDKEKTTALAFLKVIVDGAAKGQSDLETIRSTVSKNIQAYPVVAKFFTVDSPETAEFIMQAMAK